MSDSLGIHSTAPSVDSSVPTREANASSTDTKLHHLAKPTFSSIGISTTASVNSALPTSCKLSQSTPLIQSMAVKTAEISTQSHALTGKALDTAAELGEQSAIILDAVSTAGAAESSGAFSLVSCLLSFGLAVKTALGKLRPARAELRSLDQAIALIQKAIDTNQPLNPKTLAPLLPKNLSTSFDNLPVLLKGVQQARQALVHKIATYRTHISMQLTRSSLAGVDALGKFLDFGAIALKALGTLTGILVIVNAVIKVIKHGKAIHSTTKQLKELKNEWATCPKEDRAKLEQLQQQIAKLTLERKAHIFQLAIGFVELALGLAITVVHATSGGLALPILAGVLGGCAILGFVGNLYFARKQQAPSQEAAKEQKLTTPDDKNPQKAIADHIAANAQAAQDKLRQYMAALGSTQAPTTQPLSS